MQTSWSIVVAVLAFSFCPPTSASSEADNAAAQQFIACPVYRDTDAGPKSGCWLATNRETGERYDVTSALSNPILGKTILVEGRLSNEDANQCGAPVLSPVRVSILEQPCPRHIIPAEDHPGRRFARPTEVMQPLSVPRQLPEGPFQDRSYSILFNFNSHFLNYQYSEIIQEKAALYIKASQPAEVVITGYAATDAYQVSGETLQESVATAQARAEQVALALRRLAPDAETFTVEWQGSSNSIPHYNHGLPEETKRRVEILVKVP